MYGLQGTTAYILQWRPCHTPKNPFKIWNEVSAGRLARPRLTVNHWKFKLLFGESSFWKGFKKSTTMWRISFSRIFTFANPSFLRFNQLGLARQEKQRNMYFKIHSRTGGDRAKVSVVKRNKSRGLCIDVLETQQQQQQQQQQQRQRQRQRQRQPQQLFLLASTERHPEIFLERKWLSHCSGPQSVTAHEVLRHPRLNISHLKNRNQTYWSCDPRKNGGLACRGYPAIWHCKIHGSAKTGKLIWERQRWSKTAKQTQEQQQVSVRLIAAVSPATQCSNERATGCHIFAFSLK